MSKVCSVAPIMEATSSCQNKTPTVQRVGDCRANCKEGYKSWKNWSQTSASPAHPGRRHTLKILRDHYGPFSVFPNRDVMVPTQELERMLREEIPEVLELVPLWHGWVMFGRVYPVPPKYVFFFWGGGWRRKVWFGGLLIFASLWWQHFENGRFRYDYSDDLGLGVV